jgi:hypothetical protein
MTVSVITGTVSSPSFNERYGVRTSAKGSLDLVNSDEVVGMAFKVLL